MHLSIGSKIAFGFAVAVATLLAIGIVSHLNLEELTSDSGWVTHTIQVQQKLEGLQAAMLQAESSSRGYNLVPDPSFKQLSKDADVQADANFSALRNLTQDNPIEQDRLDKLQPLITERLADLKQLRDARDANASDLDAQRTPLVTRGKEQMAEIRQIISDMMGEEQGLLVQRQDRAGEMAKRTSATIIYGTLIAFVLVVSGGWIVTRSITREAGGIRSAWCHRARQRGHWQAPARKRCGSGGSAGPHASESAGTGCRPRRPRRLRSWPWGRAALLDGPPRWRPG